MYLGNPVRENIWHGNKNKLLTKEKMSGNKKTILIFGGSKGARVINQTFLDCIDLIDKQTFSNWQVLIISGKDDYSNMIEKIKLSKHKDNIYIVDYLYNIEDAYDLADLVICRSGATTVAELTAIGLPAILIPYPYATGNHQTYNARHLKNKQAAIVISQQELSVKRLADELSKILLNDSLLDIMRKNSRRIGNRNSAKEIVDIIYRDIKKEVESS